MPTFGMSEEEQKKYAAAYAEGEAAARAGKEKWQNPYLRFIGSIEYDGWRRGWVSVKDGTAQSHQAG